MYFDVMSCDEVHVALASGQVKKFSAGRVHVPFGIDHKNIILPVQGLMLL